MRTIDNDTLGQELETAGYSKYKPAAGHDNYDMLYQKRFETGSVTHYFIQVLFWNFSKYAGAEGRISYSAYVQFYQDDFNFRVEFSLNETDGVAEVEKYFAEFYERNLCIPDILNQRRRG